MKIMNMSSNKALVIANTCSKWAISMYYLTSEGSQFQESDHVDICAVTAISYSK